MMHINTPTTYSADNHECFFFAFIHDSLHDLKFAEWVKLLIISPEEISIYVCISFGGLIQMHVPRGSM